MSPIKLLIVDDHKVVREGLKAFIYPIDDMAVIGEAYDGQNAVEMATRLHPDVILMDLVMPRMDGIETTRQIYQREPKARILIITSFCADEQVIAAIEAGASGYLLKDSSPEDLEEAIRAVYKGDSYLPPAIARKVVQKFHHTSQKEETWKTLTPREIEVLRLVSKGFTNAEIAQNLTLSAWTVRSHLWRIMKKLQVDNRTQVALYAVQSGFIPATL